MNLAQTQARSRGPSRTDQNPTAALQCGHEGVSQHDCSLPKQAEANSRAGLKIDRVRNETETTDTTAQVGLENREA